MSPGAGAGLKDMFSESKAFSGFAVDDIGKAKEFYGETLGLEVKDGPAEVLLELHPAGGGEPILIYEKSDHEPATFTILNFPVDDVEAAAAKLKERGIELEHVEGMSDEDGISRDPRGPVIAWFRDPAGNILSFLEVE